jgi:hypothetical protein
MKKIILLFLLATINFPLLAQTNATLLFAKEVIEEAFRMKEDYWLGEDLNQPHGGYLHRFSCDITGDGNEEIFFKTSANDFGRHGEWWSIYHKNPQGDYQLLVKNIELDPSFGLSRYADRTEITIIRGSTRHGEGFTLFTYKINSQGHLNVSERKISMEEFEEKLDSQNKDWEKVLGAQEQFYATNLERILLADFLRDPKSKWHALHYTDFGFEPVRGREKIYEKGGRGYEDPEFENDKRRAENFTPQEAQRLIEQWKKREQEREVQGSDK